MTKLAMAALCLLAFAFPASAGWVTDMASSGVRTAAYGGEGRGYARQPHYAAHGASGARYARSYAGRGNVSGICFEAARLGGPCGCEASKLVFGQSVRNLWLVSNWLQFPRTGPQVGAAAIWPGRHVEIVTAVHGDGTVSTAGSVGFSHVSASRLVFVDPHNGGHGNVNYAAVKAATPYRVAAHYRRYRHYARNWE